MSKDLLNPIIEVGASAADFADPVYPPLPNSPVLSADVAAAEEVMTRRTRHLFDRKTNPNQWDGLNTFTAGVVVTQSTTNGDAASITGNGTGRGVSVVGGSTSGLGGRLKGGAPNGKALEAEGTGTGIGAQIAGGANAAGAEISSGGGNNPGIRAYGTGTGAALVCEVGGIEFNGTQPASTADPGANVVHATHIPKAWARITTDGIGGVVVNDGLNVASVAISGGGAVLTVNFAGAMASANYGVKATDHSLPAAGAARVYGSNSATSTASAVVIFGRTITVGSIVVVDFSTEALSLFVEVTGRQ